MRSLTTLRHAVVAATLAVAALALVLTAPGTAQAQQTYYSDLASFTAVATNTTLYDFEGIAPAYNFATNPEELTVAAPDRITFSVSGGDTNIYAEYSGLAGGNHSLNGTDSVVAGQGGNTTTLSLNGLYNYFSIEVGPPAYTSLGPPAPVSNNFTIGLYNGNTQIGTDFVTGTIGSGYFYGVTSDTAFDNVRVLAMESSIEYTVFDNARVGSAVVGSAVPEAGTLALALPALSIVGAVLVRRRTAK